METNALFLKKAAELMPVLREQEVRPIRTVAFSQTADGMVTAVETEDYRSLCLRSGDTVCLDFGDHFVGHLTFRFGFEGSHPDAPAWLRIQFAERAQELFEDADSYHGWISKGWIQQEQLHVDVLPATVALPRRYAFRYVKLAVLDVSSKYALRLTDCFCRETTCADASALPAFPLDDPELARESFDETGLIRDSDVLGWCFADWNLNLNKQAGAQAIYLYCLNALMELADGLGEYALSAQLEGEYHAKKERALSALWDTEKRVFVSGAGRQISWASQGWMVLAGVLESAEGAALLERVAAMPEAEKMVTPYLYHHSRSAAPHHRYMARRFFCANGCPRTPRSTSDMFHSGKIDCRRT